jgi:hypothetical protein
MTRKSLVFGVVLAARLLACGGSSSETPPPLEPDPRGFHYTGVSAFEREPSTASTAPAAGTAADNEKPGVAPATVGAPATQK